MNIWIHIYSYTNTAHARDQTWNIWISRSVGFSYGSFEWRGLRLFTWKLVWKFGDSRENVFDMSWKIVGNFVNIWSLISSVCGIRLHLRPVRSKFSRNSCLWSTSIIQKMRTLTLPVSEVHTICNEFLLVCTCLYLLLKHITLNLQLLIVFSFIS